VSVETEAERRVWDLLTRDFVWRAPVAFGVKVFGGSGAPAGPTRLQIFEVAVAAVFARLRPDYDWYVTPNRPDGGLDFVGRQLFLEDEALGIAAAITVGGQCKKRSHVNDIVAEVAGSLARMAATINPTFFVVALSARLTRRRVEAARGILERTHQRHCHILDRRQIEGLLREHLVAIDELLRESLSDSEVRDVLRYFESHREHAPWHSVTVAAAERVLAGVPFRVTLTVRSSIVSAQEPRLWWRPSRTTETDAQAVTLIGPIGADGPMGVVLVSDHTADDPMQAQCSIEFVTYSIGRVDLGEVLVGMTADGAADAADRIQLGWVQVVETMRPRFFERPFRAGLMRLSQEYERALARGAASIAVVGAGGSGKSRMCEEFSLERRRRGSAVASGRQAKTLDDPNRVLAELFFSLAAEDIALTDPAERVIRTVSRYDHVLAERAAPTIRSIFGTSDRMSGAVTEQSILSTLLLLIMARGRRAPLIVHLQDLHWCTADVLLLLGRLVWQLELLVSGSGTSRRYPDSGILFIFEGRVHESQGLGGDAWTSEPFEAFLQKLGCTRVSCSSFEPEDGLEFTRRLFEDRYSARRVVSKDLLELQSLLIERIYRTAGGNPFHSLEQVQLLKERRVLGQNPETGLLYMIRPEPTQPVLPDSVFESIQLRWQYLKERAPQLAILLWAAALLEDRIRVPLFRRLWREIAPDVSLGDVDATDLLWTGDGEEGEVVFRHENYFQSLRRFEVSPRDRERVVKVYSDWFDELPRLSPADRFMWARALLEMPAPNVARVRALLSTALQGARRRGDLRLARQISSASLDLAWSEDARSPVSVSAFLRRCDDELELSRDLLGNDLFRAARRLDGLRNRLRVRLSSGQVRSGRTLERLQRRQLTAEVLRSQVFFNDRQPAMASEIAARAVHGVRALRPAAASEEAGAWETLEMEALHTQAVALALSGEIRAALRTSERAVEIARGSSSPLSHNVISTYANILLARDPVTSELILRQCLADLVATAAPSEASNPIEINLSMALVLEVYGLARGDANHARSMLAEASDLLTRVFAGSFRLGHYPDAGAAALMLGIVSLLSEDEAEVSWFAQAVAAAARGRQMETLWRAHINLATALYRREEGLIPSVRDHASAALDIMEETLSPYPQPDRSARFGLMRVPLAHAVSFLILAADEAGLAALERYPALRTCFRDPRAGLLREDRGGYQSHEWLRVGHGDYVIY
jgi:hypothetical protein